MTFPGEYYFTSRYNSNFSSFIIYLAKYWGTIIIFNQIYFDLEYTACYFILFYLISMLLYFSIYDYFCCVNDNEPGAVTKRDGRFVTLGQVFFYAILLSLLGFFIFGLTFNYTIGACIFIAVTFYLHNRLSEKYRVVTYFLLYFLKPFLFIHNLEHVLVIIIFSSLYALSYIPFYFVKKFGLQWPNSFCKVICSGIFLKCFFLMCIIPFYFEFIYLLLWQILFTIFDFLSNKRFS
ncbi:hypothetical protein AEA42_08440 [Shewanella sp. Sh95]|nr:hypothetical protein AEA42_08440 [Shewanella sp. Sh95]